MASPPVREVTILGLALLLTGTIAATAGALIAYGLGHPQTAKILACGAFACGLSAMLNGLLVTIQNVVERQVEPSHPRDPLDD